MVFACQLGQQDEHQHRHQSVPQPTCVSSIGQAAQGRKHAVQLQDKPFGPQVDIEDLLKNRETVQKIYNSDYRFPPAPEKPTLTAVPGDGKVTLYWDRKAEDSFDPVLKVKDFEGYKIYRATDQNFNDIFQITDADGTIQGYTALAQFDLDNGINGLLTCSLRPVGMYGPRDKYHIANIIEVAKSNNNVKLGDGTACFSHVYSENAAHAHILAAKHLHSETSVPGECYFVADHQPANNLFEFMRPYLEELGLPVPTKSIPYRLAYFLAFFAEIFAPKSNFNRFAVIQTCVDHTFVSDKAERDFGYKPIVSKEEAFQKTVEWFKTQYNVN